MDVNKAFFHGGRGKAAGQEWTKVPRLHGNKHGTPAFLSSELLSADCLSDGLDISVKPWKTPFGLTATY